MGPKNNKLHMRVNRSTKERLAEIKLKGETDAELLERLVKMFRKRGVAQEITQKIIELGEITGRYISPGIYETLEMFRTWLILLTKMKNGAQRLPEINAMFMILERRVATTQKQIEEF